MASLGGGGGGQGPPNGSGVPTNRPVFTIEGRVVEPPTLTAAQLDMIRSMYLSSLGAPPVNGFYPGAVQYPRGVFVPSNEYEAAGAARAAKRAKQTDISAENELAAKTTGTTPPPAAPKK
ncbi:hypothetical protein OsI_07782 [Oryza sativa Indica Group]|uniref:Uncharacterized protein n=2 Tax=Oryza TaxID=4527 RepID=A0A0D3F6T3_9ORYZ|nr:hypothetical protein OsI_07782 [Oryza sativa Indica Group]